MEKRILGIILSVMGIVGLVIAGMNVINKGNNTDNFKSVMVFAILGLVFFFAGIGLIRSTKDVRNKDEEIS